jgi:uncharacterized protein YjbI with pentapeptide repeats
MANPEHLKILRQGVESWNLWRRTAFFPDLHGADIGRAKLKDAALFETDLSQANLSEADLTGADLRRVLEFKRLSVHQRGSELHITRHPILPFTPRSLRQANLSGALLLGANLCGADLTGADLTGAHLGGTLLAGTNLSGAKGLGSCDHRGPSKIDFQTLRISGPLPLSFLRGCGVPDVLIEYLPSLLGQAIQFYSCFISYSTDDQDFADRLHADLQNKGVRCWFAPHDIQAGRKLEEQIDEAIRMYDRLLLILSEHSMRSEWVKTEIARARQKELNEQRQVLFPITLVPFERIKEWKNFDADTGKDSAREIREYFVPDFSAWKDHDSYQKAFERLVGDLKAEKSGPALSE